MEHSLPAYTHYQYATFLVGLMAFVRRHTTAPQRLVQAGNHDGRSVASWAYPQVAKGMVLGTLRPVARRRGEPYRGKAVIPDASSRFEGTSAICRPAMIHRRYRAGAAPTAWARCTVRPASDQWTPKNGGAALPSWNQPVATVNRSVIDCGLFPPIRTHGRRPS